jgi:glycosyltransferase involved in cell wall biosynthesis
MSGAENPYAARVRRRYERVENIKFAGRLTRAEVFEQFSRSDCLVFPSKLETWGLPISEFKPTGRPMLLADLPYAWETAGDYPQVAYFDVFDPETLARQMATVIAGAFVPHPRSPVTVPAPFAKNWNETWKFILNEDCSAGVV